MFTSCVEAKVDTESLKMREVALHCERHLASSYVGCSLVECRSPGQILSFFLLKYGRGSMISSTLRCTPVLTEHLELSTTRGCRLSAVCSTVRYWILR